MYFPGSGGEHWLRAHPPAHSLSALSRTRGENRMKKLDHWNKGKVIAYQVLPWSKQTSLGENWFNLWQIKIDLDNKKTNFKTIPFLPPFPGPASPGHIGHLYPPRAVQEGTGNGGLWSLHKGSSLPLLPPDTFPLLQHGLSPQAAFLQEKVWSIVGCPRATVPPRQVHWLWCGSSMACSGYWLWCGLLTVGCGEVSAVEHGAAPPLTLVFPLLFHTLSVPCLSTCVALFALLDCVLSKGHHFGWGARLCPAMGLLDLDGTTCVQHRAPSSSPLQGHPCGSPIANTLSQTPNTVLFN